MNTWNTETAKKKYFSFGTRLQNKSIHCGHRSRQNVFRKTFCFLECMKVRLSPPSFTLSTMKSTTVGKALFIYVHWALNHLLFRKDSMVLVFKTSVSANEEVKQLRPLLNKLIRQNGNWNFDLEDCDNILRVETQLLKAENISTTLHNQGFYCEELL